MLETITLTKQGAAAEAAIARGSAQYARLAALVIEQAAMGNPEAQTTAQLFLQQVKRGES